MLGPQHHLDLARRHEGQHRTAQRSPRQGNFKALVDIESQRSRRQDHFRDDGPPYRGAVGAQHRSLVKAVDEFLQQRPRAARQIEPRHQLRGDSVEFASGPVALTGAALDQACFLQRF
jgi:hypothetical protein